MDDPRHFVCILAGGSGERFWPMSRRNRPKHLIQLFGERTLLEETVLRAEKIVPRERILVLTNCDQLAAIRQLLPSLSPDQIVAEPAKRDTAPAAALATALARVRHPEAVVAVMPADALVHDGETFARQIREGFAAATIADAFVTLAVHPLFPATGFGYIELGAPLHVAVGLPGGFRSVVRFVEKPDEAKARHYLASGRFGWNAGVFIWSSALFLREADRLQPELSAFIRAFPALAAEVPAYLEKTFAELPKNSIDYALMEKAARVVTAWAEFDWDDVGAWTALPSHFGQDEAGNTIRGSGVVADGANNIVVSNGRTIALYGVDDLVVVETEDAILVCPRSKAQGIKGLQAKLPPGLA